MSPKNSLLTVGLTALGLFGYSAIRVAYSAEPVAPPGPLAAPAPNSNSTPSVLMLSDGRLLQGTVKKTAESYILIQNGGEIPFPRSRVEEVFASLTDVYLYKRDQVPPNDPDEHLKLARWCLGYNLQKEAKAEIQMVVKFSPNSREARMMLASMQASEARIAARPRVDPGLVQTRAEMTIPGSKSGDARPAEIDPRILRNAGRELGVSGLPIIFDLPPAQAVKRADQFARVVHPVLQATCVKCHNENYAGKFQLVEVRGKRDRTANVFRANLDATLRFIDPENPSQSELLSTTLLPHGNGPNPKPIFKGSNDPKFQILAAWVYTLRAGKSADPLTQARFNSGRPDGGGFASERSAAGASGATRPGRPLGDLSDLPTETINAPPTRYVEGKGFVTEKAPPGADEFPGPYTLPKPKAVPVNGPVPVAEPKPGTVAEPKTAIPLPVVKPGVPPEGLPALPEADGAAAKEKSKPKKPVKLDNALLQRVLQNRNSGR